MPPGACPQWFAKVRDSEVLVVHAWCTYPGSTKRPAPPGEGETGRDRARLVREREDGMEFEVGGTLPGLPVSEVAEADPRHDNGNAEPLEARG